MKNEIKRLFFGWEIASPWPEKFPKGRLLDENHRHMTLFFLGETDYPKLIKALENFPTPPFKMGVVGKFDQCLLLPKHFPNVVAWHGEFLEKKKEIFEFQKNFGQWLIKHDLFHKDSNREWLPHTTMCRKPFDFEGWKNSFHSLPFITGPIHLYESLGNLQYRSCWNYPLRHAFEEISHTADIAFHIFGETIEDLYLHAQMALAFKFPPLISFLSEGKEKISLDDMIIELNEIVTKADTMIGCPFKAISFHGELEQKENLLLWEMIVDV